MLMTVTTMPKEVQQRAGKKEKIRQRRQHVAGVSPQQVDANSCHEKAGGQSGF